MKADRWQRLVVFMLAWVGMAAAAGAAQLNDTWIGGTGVWSVASNWSLGVVPNNGADTFNVFIDGSVLTNSLANLDFGVTINNLTVRSGDALAILDGRSLSIVGSGGTTTVTNSGVIVISAGGNNADLRIGGTLALTGGGTISLGANFNGRLFGAAGGEVLLNQDNTIRGAGQLGANNISLVNNGAISANQSNQVLQVDLTDNPPSTNAALMEASNGGILEITGNTTLINSGGAIRALNGSVVNIRGSSTIIGGTLTNAGTGVIQGFENAVLQDVRQAGLLQVPDAQTLFLRGTIANNGTMVMLASANNNADLRLSGNVTLTGGGAVNLGANFNGRLLGAVGGEVLLNQDNTIRGAGQLGANVNRLDNHGTINANQSNQVLQVDLQDSPPSTNAALMEASNGGILFITGNTTLINSGGTIQALNNSTVQIRGNSTVIGGTLTNSSSGALFGFESAVLQDVRQAGLLQVPDAQTLFLRGVIANTGTMALLAAGNNADLRLSGNVTLTGGGAVNLGANFNGRLLGAVGGEVLLNQNNTISGAGQLGANNISLVNNGAINANQSNQVLQVDLQDSPPSTNAALMEASNGGILFITGNTTLINLGGTIQALNDSTVQIRGNSTVIGGTLTNSSSGALFGFESAVLQDVRQAGLLQVPDAQTLFLRGTITNNGTMVMLASANNNADLRLSGNVTLTGGGAVNLGNNINGRLFGAGGGEVLSNQNNTISGAGQLGVNNISLVNNGAISANQSNQVLQVDLADSPSSINAGLMQATNGATLQITGNTTLMNSAGTIQALNGSAVNIRGGSTIVGGTLATSGSGVINGFESAVLQDFRLAGLLQVPDAQTLFLRGTITNNGTMALLAASSDADLRLSGNVTLTGGGAVNLGINSNGRLFGNGGGEVLLNQNNTIHGAGQLGVNNMGLVNNGAIIADQPAGLTIDPNDSAGFLNNGTLQVGSGIGLNVAGPGFLNFVGGNTLTGGAYRVAGTLQFDNANIVNNAATIILDGAASVIQNQSAANGLANFANNTAAGSFTLQNGRVFSASGPFVNLGAMQLLSSGSFRESTSFVNGDFACTVPATLTVNGGSLFVTNAGHNAVLDVRSGTVTLSAGLIEVDNLVVSNSCARFLKTGGTLTILGATNLPPNLDADGDGFSNGDEAKFGSDPLNADSVPHVLSATPAILNLGVIATGMTAQASFQVSNSNTNAFTGTAAVDGGPFAILSGSPYTVASPVSTNVVVSFTPTAQGRFTNTVIFTSNGGNATNIVIGTGVAFPPGDVNADGKVTGSDSLLIDQVLVGLRNSNDAIFATAGFPNGDVNASANVTSADSLLIDQVLVGLRSYITTDILPASHASNQTTAVTIFGVGFPTNQVPTVTIGAPVNLPLSNVVVLSREKITAVVPAGGGLGTGTVNVVSSPTNGVISFGRFINQ